MIAKIFIELTEYPFFRRLVWKPIYNALAKHIKVDRWYFMNYGFAPTNDAEKIRLNEEDEINRTTIQSYHFLAVKSKIEGKELLEVGCGRGGGTAYIANYLHPAKITGIDVAENAISFAQKHHQAQNLAFAVGNAEKMPFPDENFDVLLNVESAHGYGSVPAFLAEAHRVLRSGGTLLVTDMRAPSGMEKFLKNIADSAFELVEHEDVTPNVIKSIETENDVKTARIEQNVPAFLQGQFKEFAGTKDSEVYKGLLSGDLIYHRFVLKKN
jgi:ubiquinone/menaquinone biosynthesis C-methylase UbiE